MDHDLIVDQAMQRCKQLLTEVLHDQDLRSVATASVALFTQMREVARAMLQAKIELEAARLKQQPVASCCPEADMGSIHTRTVSPTTLFGTVEIPVRTFRCAGCRTTVHPDDVPLGVPQNGNFTDDVCGLYTPLAAELPHRVSNEILRALRALISVRAVPST